MASRSRLIWTTPALDDLDDIASYIAAENLTAARALVRRVVDAVERLRHHPDLGRWVPEVDSKLYREVIVPPCRVIYRRDGSKIVIIYVVRSERMLRPSRLV